MTRRALITAAVGCTVLIAVAADQIQAQKSDQLKSARQSEKKGKVDKGRRATKTFSRGGRKAAKSTRKMSKGAKIAKKKSAAINKYKAAKSEEDRAAAEKELRAALVEQFDVLVKQREAHLADLKGRIERLTAQLQKRRDAKGEIVDLRLNVLLFEANGLGFFPDANSLPGRRSLVGSRRGYDFYYGDSR